MTRTGTERSAEYPANRPMRIQARQGSDAEKAYYNNSSLPGLVWPKPKQIAPGVNPAPLEDLIFHGGKIVPQMEFQNIYLGSPGDYTPGDTDLIDAAIKRAMQAKKLNNVMVQYFPGATLSCDTRPSVLLNEAKPAQLDEPDVQAKVIALLDSGKLTNKNLG